MISQYTQALISVNFNLIDIGVAGNPTRFEAGSPVESPLVEQWADIEIVPDFVLNTWKAYANGDPTEFANGTINISGFGDFKGAIGWSLDLNWAHNTDSYVCLSTLIDRVGVALPLTNKFDNDLIGLPPVKEFNINYGANQMSMAELTLLDDDNNYTLAPITTGTDATEWRMLMFESGEDRPIWSGHIESINHQQQTYNNTLKTTIRASDSFAVLGRTLPIWELGQSAFFSLNNHISMDATYEKRTSETSAISSLLLFGIGNMVYKSNALGFTRHDNEEVARYSNILNGRQSLFLHHLFRCISTKTKTGQTTLRNNGLGIEHLPTKKLKTFCIFATLQVCEIFTSLTTEKALKAHHIVVMQSETKLN